MTRIKSLTSKEICLECGEKPSGRKKKIFFEPRFDLINEKNLLNSEKLKQFNKFPYYKKRHFIAELIKKGIMI